MKLLKLKPLFKKLNLLPLILTGLLLLNSGCAKFIRLTETIPDAEWCAPVLDTQGNVVFAACDWFMESNPETLTPPEWAQKQQSWVVTQCTPSSNMVNLKKFVEDTCSENPCDEATKQLFLARFDRVAKLGVR